MVLISRTLLKLSYRTSNDFYSFNKIIRWATKNSKYYASVLNDKSAPPILTKDILRSSFWDIVVSNYKNYKWFYNTSGGSTGEPVKFIQDSTFLYRSRECVLNQYKALGWNAGDRIIKLWGDDRIWGTPLFDRLMSGVKNYIKGEQLLNTMLLNEQLMEKYIKIINQTQPKLIVGYASSLAQIAKYITDSRIVVKPPKAIISSAGMLYEDMRDSIEDAFGTKVFNSYGSREVGLIAYEDNESYRKYMNVSQMNFVEEQDNSLLITSLANEVMPLIRYKIGDEGIACSENGKIRIKNLKGRSVEIFKTNNGARIDGEFFTHLLYHKNWVKNFQFVQKNYSRVTVNIVLNDVQSDSEKINIDRINIDLSIKNILGHDTIIDWNFLDSIKKLPSGKHVYTISEIP